MRLLTRTHTVRFILNPKSFSKDAQNLISGDVIQETGLIINYRPLNNFGKSKITTYTITFT